MKRNVGSQVSIRVLGALIIALGFVGSAWSSGGGGRGHDSDNLPECDYYMCKDFYYHDEGRVIVILDPDKPTFNPELCTCNVEFAECNPAITRKRDRYRDKDKDKDKDTDRKRSCLSGEPLRAFPGNLDLVNDGTTVCRTIGGQTKCWTKQ